MPILDAELDELVATLKGYISDCVAGRISFPEFLNAYGYPTGEYVMDGHEEGVYEHGVLESHAQELKLFFDVAERVLDCLCSAEQALDPAYAKAGRIGPDAALEILKALADKHGLRCTTFIQLGRGLSRAG